MSLFSRPHSLTKTSSGDQGRSDTVVRLSAYLIVLETITKRPDVIRRRTCVGSEVFFWEDQKHHPQATEESPCDRSYIAVWPFGGSSTQMWATAVTVLQYVPRYHLARSHIIEPLHLPTQSHTDPRRVRDLRQSSRLITCSGRCCLISNICLGWRGTCWELRRTKKD